MIVFVLFLESSCQIGKSRNHRYRLVVLTGADGMTLSATCPSFDEKVGAEALRPTQAQIDSLVVPDTPGKWCSIGCLLLPQVRVQVRLNFTPMVWVLPWK